MKKTTKPKVVKAVKVVEKDEFIITLKVLGKLFTAKGSSVKEALTNLDVKNVRGVGILTVQHKGKSKERILSPIILSRMFNMSGTMREVGITKLASTLEI